MIRRAAAADFEKLVDIWRDGFREAHAGLVPEALYEKRTPANLGGRLAKMGDALRVAGPAGAPLGMCVVTDAELSQIYVAPAGRGTGMAQALLADGQARIAAGGHARGWLKCALGNERAAAFYLRQGWENMGVVTLQLDLPEGPFPLDVCRFEVALDS